MSIPSGLWTRQFDVAHDYLATPVAIPYAICTTPRCGSHYLGHLLHSRQSFGYPLEYVHPRNFEHWRERSTWSSNARVYAFIKSIRTGPNGCFGIKLHYSHLQRFLAVEEEALSFRFVLLRRRDMLAQAISFARAAQTGAWISEMPDASIAHYDYNLIAKKLEEIGRSNANWLAFFAAAERPYLSLYYEDILNNPDAAIAQLANFLDIQPGPASDSFLPKKQSSISPWASRFVAEKRARLLEASGHNDSKHKGSDTPLNRLLRQARGMVRTAAGR